MSASNVLLFLVITAVCLPGCWASVTKRDCGSLKDCANDKELHICALDGKNTCFRRFNSPCEMDYAACKDDKVYSLFEKSFCYLDNFMCDAEYEEYQKMWARQERMDDTILAIYA